MDASRFSVTTPFCVLIEGIAEFTMWKTGESLKTIFFWFGVERGTMWVKLDSRQEKSKLTGIVLFLSEAGFQTARGS